VCRAKCDNGEFIDDVADAVKGDINFSKMETICSAIPVHADIKGTSVVVVSDRAERILLQDGDVIKQKVAQKMLFT
jgi:hypothetical protein